MREHTAFCDICGEKIPKEISDIRIAFFEERHNDGAGSMENDYVYPDLCHKHATVFLRYLAKEIKGSTLAEHWKKFIKVKKCFQ